MKDGVKMKSILFWDYYLSEPGPQRDLKLEKIFPNIVPSNLIVGMLVFSLVAFFTVANESSPVLVVLSVIAVLASTIFQYKTCWEATKRVHEIGSLREAFKDTFLALGIIPLIMAEELIKGLDDVINEFFADAEYEDENYQQQQQRYREQYQTNRQSSYDESSEAKRIFNKYDLAFDSDIEIINKRFRSLAKQYHPDMPTGDEKLFIELREDLYFLREYTKSKSKMSA